MSEQYQFEFNQWAEAFEMFYRKKAKDDAFCLVISTAPYASGYWIERDAVTEDCAKVYRTRKAVKELERRIKRIIEKQPRPLSAGVIT